MSMSIFGPCSPTSGGVSDTTDHEGVDLSVYAKKKRVSRLVNDAVDTCVAKTGDTMSGDLDMGGNLVYGLPTDFPFSIGDAAVSRTQVLLLAEGEEMARRARKPLITVWAAEKGALNNKHYEWSFGNGGDGEIHGVIGYTMMAPGRILRGGLSASSSGSAQGTATVNLVVNGTEQTSYGVTKPAGQYSGTSIFEPPLEVAPGDRLNFRSATPSICTNAIVCLLIELRCKL